MRVVRDWLVRILFVSGLAALAGLAWLTRNPDAELLARATELPLIGGVAERFRELYRQAPSPTPGHEPGPEIVYVEGPGLAAEEPDRVIGARPVVWVEEESPLLASPEAGAEEVARTAGIANLRVFDRRGDWYRVRYRGGFGWVHLPGYEESATPPLGSDPEPPRPLPGRPPDPERLAAARRLLAQPETVTRVGPYALHTDVADGALHAFLDRVANGVERAYRERYGLAPIGEPAAAVVLFGRRADFVEYQGRETRLHGLGATGVTGGGLVALELEGRPRPEVAATLVHEIVHLLNRRALGPALPGWLDEGLADDLAQSEISEDGTLRPARLGGLTIERWNGWEWRGARAAAIELRRALDQGRLLPLAELLALEWEEFVAPGRSTVHYGQASFWIRHLLDGGDPRLAAGFRAYLLAVASGEPAGPEELRRRLGRGWPELDEAFAAWVRRRFHDPA